MHRYRYCAHVLVLAKRLRYNGTDTTLRQCDVNLSSPSFARSSRSTSPTVRARRAGGAPDPAGHGIRPQPARAGPHFHCATGFCLHPLTRACVRLLGPCFKTGRVGCRHRRRPLAPFTWAEPRPGGTTRLGRTEDSPGRQSHRGRGPVPPRRREGAASTLSTAWSRCKAAAASHLRPEPFQADLEPVAAHRLVCGTPQPAVCRSHPPAGC